VNNNIYKVSSGDVIFSKPTDVHHCICNETCPHEHFCVWIDTGANSELDEVLKGLTTGILRTEKESRKEELFNNLSTLHSLFETENHFAKTALLFSVINTAINNNAQISVNGEPLPKNLQNILNYMNENFANIQYINEIQSKFFISSSTLNRWFKQYIHLSPHEFLEAKKLGYAEQLLQKGFSVTETAEISGFPDTSHFISVFKRKFGTTPHKYKKV
jgi:AraC-like DNA-binding protein